MSYSDFTDKTHKPTLTEMKGILGDAFDWWQTLENVVTRICGAQPELKFYGKNYGWMAAYKKGGKLLLALYPRRNGLVVQMILKPVHIEEALRLGTGQGFRTAVENAYEYAEGRWVFYPLENEQDLDLIQHLINMKAGKSPC